MESELNRELRRLQRKYKAGFDIIRVDWCPTSKIPRNELSEEGKWGCKGERVHAEGNITRWIIRVYEQYDFNEAIHIVHHEFLEHLVMKPAHTFVELSNVLLKLINKFQYETQEDVVETLAKMEDKEYVRIQKRPKKY